MAQLCMTRSWKLSRSAGMAGLAIALGALISLVDRPISAVAQIVPDDSLGDERSQVVSSRVRLIDARITGGAVRGTSLFHSFQDFNVGEGQRVYFDEPAGIENILSRVTGANPSRILGTLGVLGTANLFLLNPNGIVFGADARLEIGGSFTASAASRFRFADGSEFSAINPQAPPLLRLSVPVGLQFSGRSTDISNAANLRLHTNQSLTLQGRTVSNTAALTTDGGSVRLLADRNLILTGSPALITTNGGDVLLQAQGDIRLNQSSISLTVPPQLENNSGRVTLQAGQNISLNRASVLSRVLPGMRGNAGAVSLKAGDTLSATGSLISSTTEGNGNRAETSLQARSLLLNGSTLFSTTLSAGEVGILRLRAIRQLVIDADSIVATGANRLNSTGRGGTIDIRTGDARQTEAARRDRVVIRNSRLSTGTDNAGVAGRLEIYTGQLTVDNATVSTATLGAGDAGDIRIEAARSVLVSAQESTVPVTSSDRRGINASVGEGSAGRGGDLSIHTPDLRVQDDGEVASSTFAAGDAGRLRLRVRNLSVQRGGQISVSTNGDGNAGRLDITADNAVTVSDRSDTRQSGVFARSLGDGSGGGLLINADRLSVSRGAAISVSGVNNPGNLTINADRVLLDNGTLEAVTQAGVGANIELNNRDYLLLRDRGLISAEALNNGSGGNITINAKNGFIIAAGGISGNNDIIANANEGDGGQITITAEALFGLSEQARSPFTNDIDASSRFGLNGETQINQPDVDPSRGLVELPTVLTDASSQIDRVCPTGNVEGEFVVTGRGGLPQTPVDLLSNDNIVSPWVTAAESDIEDTHGAVSSDRHLQSLPPTHSPIIEASGWVRRRGKVMLVADPVPMETTAPIALPAPKSCP